MRRKQLCGALVAALSLGILSGCQSAERERSEKGNPNGPNGDGNGGLQPAPDGGFLLPDGSAAKLVPAHIRRLTNKEFEASVRALFPTTQVVFTDALAVDARQSDFTRNEAQRVDPLLAGQYQTLAQAIASEAVAGDLAALVPCAAEATRECAAQFVDTFAAKAYRRPLSEEDKAALLTVYDAGAEGGAFKDGIELVIQAVLQSASFLYHTEIGTGTGENGSVHLTDYEIASQLAYLLTGQPPDAELLAAAAAGTLSDPAERERHARRILEAPDSWAQLEQMQQLFIEWLGIDGVTNLAKNPEAFPDWDDQRHVFLHETKTFISEVMKNDGARLSQIFGADYTYVPNADRFPELLGTFYGVPTPPAGRMLFPAGTRRGILMQPAFLARRAKEAESAPVLRGVAVLRRVMCISISDPGALNLMVVPPPPDPTLTTRERFAVHAADPACASCHDAIDGVGFTFENFDAIGRIRTTENGKPVDTSGFVDGGTDMDGAYANAVELMAALSNSERVRKCFATNFYRFATAQSEKRQEETFVEGVWGGLDASGKDNVAQIVISYVKSDLFVVRRPE